MVNLYVVIWSATHKEMWWQWHQASNCRFSISRDLNPIKATIVREK